MKVTLTVEVKDTKDLALALIDAAANIDHGNTYEDSEYWNVRVQGTVVGKIVVSETEKK